MISVPPLIYLQHIFLIITYYLKKIKEYFDLKKTEMDSDKIIEYPFIDEENINMEN